MARFFHPQIIRAQLGFLGLSQAKLARQAKLSNPRLSRLLTGRFQPRNQEIVQIGEALSLACADEGLSSIGVVLKAPSNSQLRGEAEADGTGCVKIRLEGHHHFLSPGEAGLLADFIDEALADLGTPRKADGPRLPR